MRLSARRLLSLRRRWWIATIVLAAVAGGGLWWTQRDSQAAGSQTTTATVTRGDFSTTVTASGTIVPSRQEDLSFAVSGEVTAVRVAAGDHVRRGEVLARIDDSALRAQRDAAQSSLDAALAQLDDDQDNDAGASQLAADAASVAAARSQLAQAQDAVDDATLRSPIRGTVSAVDLTVGDQVGGAASSDGTAAVTVVSTGSFEVDASVGASDAASLKKGMQVEITPTGATETVYGTVTDIGAIATVDSSGVATFPVTIDVTGNPKGLYAGSSSDVTITTRKVTDVLTVPTPALHTENGKTWVWVVDGSDRRQVTITTGTTYGMDTQVKSGLEEGDVVEIEFFVPTGTGGTGGGGQGPVTEFQGPPPGVAPQGSLQVGP